MAKGGQTKQEQTKKKTLNRLTTTEIIYKNYWILGPPPQTPIYNIYN